MSEWIRNRQSPKSLRKTGDRTAVAAKPTAGHYCPTCGKKLTFKMPIELHRQLENCKLEKDDA